MQKQNEETNYIPVTNKQVIGALATLILTLGSIVGIGSSYFISNIINSINVISTDVEFNSVAVELIKQNHTDCQARQEEFKQRFIKLFDIAEIKFDTQISEIATLKAQRVANSDLILECLRIVREN